MKKILSFLILALGTNCALAGGVVDPKINTLKKIYGNGTLDKYSTSDFKGIMDTASLSSGNGCIDWDPTIDGQDTYKFAVLNYKSINSNTVATTITNFGKKSTIYYKFVCKGNSCLINDIIDSRKGSLRQLARKCASEQSYN